MNVPTGGPSGTLAPVYLNIITRDEQGGGFRKGHHLNGGLTHAEATYLQAPTPRKRRAHRITGAFVILGVLAVAVGSVIAFVSQADGRSNSTPTVITAAMLMMSVLGGFISQAIARKEERRADAAAAATAAPYMDKLHAMQPYVTPDDLLELADQLRSHRNESALIEVTPALADTHTRALRALGNLAQIKRPDANVQGRQASAATHLHHIPEVKAAADAYEQSVANRAAALMAAREYVNKVGKLVADEKVIADARRPNP